MSPTAARLAALERQARTDGSVTVWHQGSQGADSYPSRPPDVTVTRAQLDAWPEPANGVRVVVEYVDASAAARQPVEPIYWLAPSPALRTPRSSNP